MFQVTITNYTKGTVFFQLRGTQMVEASLGKGKTETFRVTGDPAKGASVAIGSGSNYPFADQGSYEFREVTENGKPVVKLMKK